MLESTQQEAADIEATASATPADGWGDLALPLLRASGLPAAQQQQQQQSGGACAASSPASAPPLPLPAQLVQCRRCRKVLLACSALDHQQQCTQLEEPAADAGSLSEGNSSSDGALQAAPSASRGSKRKRVPGTVTSGGGGAGGKQSRLSQGGRRRAASVEASPSLGECCCALAPGQPRAPTSPVFARIQWSSTLHVHEAPWCPSPSVGLCVKLPCSGSQVADWVLRRHGRGNVSGGLACPSHAVLPSLVDLFLCFCSRPRLLQGRWCRASFSSTTSWRCRRRWQLCPRRWQLCRYPRPCQWSLQQ